MGYAILTLLPGGRVTVDAAKVEAVQDAAPGDGSGPATVWMDSGASWRCSESLNTVQARITQARGTDGTVGP